jgi:hypothetical protein
MKKFSNKSKDSILTSRVGEPPKSTSKFSLQKRNDGGKGGVSVKISKNVSKERKPLTFKTGINV